MERVLRLVINDLILAQVVLHPPLKRPDLVHQYLGVSGRDERRREVLEADLIELLARRREIRRRRGECQAEGLDERSGRVDIVRLHREDKVV